jgi:RNase P subunit RPR2
MMRRLKHFICPACKEVVIKHKAERHLLTSTQQVRDSIASYCGGAPDGMVTLIKYRKSGAGDVSELVAEYLPYQEALAE